MDAERIETQKRMERVKAKTKVLAGALEAAEKESSILTEKESQLRAEMKNVEAGSMKLHREAKARADEIALKIGEHQTLSKL